MRKTFAGLDLSRGLTRIGRERAVLARVAAVLVELRETLAAGVVPDSSRWSALRELPEPWGTLAHESLAELRARGGSVLPTLKRLHALAVDQDRALVEARARSSQALAQAVACGALVPLFGAALGLLLPELAEQGWRWATGCVVAFCLAGSGALWMLRLAEQARWGGLPIFARSWTLAAFCAGERFLALLRTGTPADLGWVRTCELLSQSAPELAARWGASVWVTENEGKAPQGRKCCALGTVLTQAGGALKKAVQVSLMEGRPCAERVEAGLLALRHEVHAQVERELGLLSTRALKPLFICVAPSLMGLLGYALWLGCLKEVAGAGLGF